MYLKSITHGLATITLSPEDCTVLHRACCAAFDAFTRDQHALLHVEALDAALTAIAIASYAQIEMSIPQLAQLDAQLQSAALPF